MGHEYDPSHYTGYENPGLTPADVAESFRQKHEHTYEFAPAGADVHTEFETTDGRITVNRDEIAGVEPDEENGTFIVRLAKSAAEHKPVVISVTGAALLAGAAAWVYRRKKHH